MTDWQEDLITVEAAGTLDGLFIERVRRSPDTLAYRDYDRENKNWRDFSWCDAAEHVACWKAALSKEGLDHGDRVAIRLRNSLEWVCFDQAALGEGLVTVPLYVEDRPDNVAYILGDAAVSLLLLQSLAQWNKLEPALENNTALKRVLILDSVDQAERESALAADTRVRFVDDWLPGDAPAVARRNGDPHELASIVYTSGTTGRSKGVMLSHHNMLSVAHAAMISVSCYQEDLFLSFLPLSHTLERTAGYYLPMMAGAAVAHARSVPQLAEDLLTIQPTAMIAVPRIFERVHGRIMAQLENKSPVARKLFEAAVRIGWRCFRYQQGEERWSPVLLLNPLLKKLVGDKVTAKLGGRMRYAISGGAALPLSVSKVFIGLGLEVLQGYGLTETSPIISVNVPERNDPDTVGEPCRGIEVRIGKNDELLVNSPGVMLGYWNNHAATAEMIDPDGWLHTGDQARIDEKGRIKITGRLKDILVLSNGEKIPPADMESAICLDPLFEQALVIGECKPCLAALIVFNADLWFGFVKELGLDPFDRNALDDERLQKKVLSRIQVQLHDFPGYARIRRVNLSLDPWTVEDGLVTPTLKTKRAKILERHEQEVENMYCAMRR
ncbi:Long-chain-fatty-acid--CoA ligase [hydrothermal vent metagenome]|uniref:Long-chain-fatty-acid--CoA ligase n=1 Tax=hydrothermal vent metagenome TaxID=652676 RepID=A0A3B0YBU5_9ZZZZ